MTAKPLKPITFFIDRCLGSKDIAQELRQAGIRVEIHDDHFSQGAQDVEWIPEVGKREWVIFTKDGKIGRNQLEKRAVYNAKIKMFLLASKNLSGSEMAEVLKKYMLEIQDFARKHSPPFIAKVYKNGKIEMWKSGNDLKK